MVRHGEAAAPRSDGGRVGCAAPQTEPRTTGRPQSGQSAPSRRRWCAPLNGSRPAEWLRGAADVEQQWPVDARAAAVEGAGRALVAPLLQNRALWDLPVGY
jgi:hypothetical protein